MSRYHTPAIIAEPACPSDAASISAMMQRSYGQLLAKDYADDVLECALPMMTKAQPDLLATGTYFVVRNAISAETVAALNGEFDARLSLVADRIRPEAAAGQRPATGGLGLPPHAPPPRGRSPPPASRPGSPHSGPPRPLPALPSAPHPARPSHTHRPPRPAPRHLRSLAAVLPGSRRPLVGSRRSHPPL